MSTEWTSFERVKAALEHREPDKIPFDLGGSVLTGINKVAYQNLRKYLGLPEKPLEIVDPIQQLARVHEDVQKRLKVDVYCLDPGAPKVSPLAAPITQEGDYYTFNDEWGISWRMPVKGGFYFDMRKHPLANAETVAELEKYPWPDPLDEGRFAGIKKRADQYVYQEKKAYILGRNSAGIFEIALWTRGFENFFMDLALNPDFAEALLDIITEMKMKYWARALKEVGENVLVISEADDLGTQNSLLVSKEMYQKFIAPRHKKLFNFIRKTAQNKVHIFYHTCGAIKEMIPYLMEEGVDVLNPVQVSARDMDTRELKKLFGNEVTFWGGGVDTQRILPRGTTAEVKQEVKKRIEDLAPGGGFVFATIHNVQGDVSPENFMAMWEALQEFGTYR